MKRHKNLWASICSFENIEAAARETMLGKRGKAAGARFFGEWEQEVVRLERELCNGSYQPGSYHYFKIHEPKKRASLDRVPCCGHETGRRGVLCSVLVQTRHGTDPRKG
jgi:hypothetical protein